MSRPKKQLSPDDDDYLVEAMSRLNSPNPGTEDAVDEAIQQESRTMLTPRPALRGLTEHAVEAQAVPAWLEFMMKRSKEDKDQVNRGVFPFIVTKRVADDSSSSDNDSDEDSSARNSRQKPPVGKRRAVTKKGPRTGPLPPKPATTATRHAMPSAKTVTPQADSTGPTDGGTNVPKSNEPDATAPSNLPHPQKTPYLQSGIAFTPHPVNVTSGDHANPSLAPQTGVHGATGVNINLSVQKQVEDVQMGESPDRQHGNVGDSPPSSSGSGATGPRKRFDKEQSKRSVEAWVVQQRWQRELMRQRMAARRATGEAAVASSRRQGDLLGGAVAGSTQIAGTKRGAQDDGSDSGNWGRPSKAPKTDLSNQQAVPVAANAVPAIHKNQAPTNKFSAPTAQGPSTHVPQFQEALFALNQPITADYARYTLPITVYELNPSIARTPFARVFLDRLVEAVLDSSPTTSIFWHASEGFIANDGNMGSLLIMHNAANPFTRRTGPNVTSTTIGAYGLHSDHEDIIEFVTISPCIRAHLRIMEERDAFRYVFAWKHDGQPTLRRFHKAYWLCANRLWLGGLLKRAPRVQGAETRGKETQDEDMQEDAPAPLEAKDELADVDTVPPSNDYGVNKKKSNRAWKWLLEAVDIAQKEEEARRGGDKKVENHRVLWSSEWGPEEVIKGAQDDKTDNDDKDNKDDEDGKDDDKNDEDVEDDMEDKKEDE